MKTLILLAHPNMQTSIINKTLIETIKDEPNITIHDLYKTYVDIKIDIDKEVNLLKNHERIVFQFPLYWFSTPSALKEWQDLIFSNILYGPNPKLLEGKVFQIVTSAGSPEDKYSTDGRNQKNLEEILLPLTMSAQYMKMHPKPIFCVFNASGMTSGLLKKAQEEYKTLLLS